MKIRSPLSNATASALLIAATWNLSPGADTNSISPQRLPKQSMLTMGGIVTTPERVVSPRMNGTNLPAPPMQTTPWTPPVANMPTNYISATSSLFDQGLADPRGCEYREIEVGVGNVWSSDGGLVSTHGWVLPGKEGPRFAICWNGLVYPIAKLGTNCDLEADVANLVTNGFTTWFTAIPEGMSVSQLSLLGIKGCLLLRLGRADLAGRFWQIETSRGRERLGFTVPREKAAGPQTNEFMLPESDPYLQWAVEWTWALFDRAVCAHMRGDDGLALASARTLSSIQQVVEAEADQRGFKRHNYFDTPRQHLLMPHLDFLEPLPALLADQERRARTTRRPTVLEAGLTNYPNASERIAALIEDLDQVLVTQQGQPGGLGPWSWNATVGAVISQGTDAIEPLLRYLEMDADLRLTRSVSFGRDFHRGRYLHSAAEPVVESLHAILHATSFGSWASSNQVAAAGTNANRRTAAQIRAYWQKFGAVPLEERWYQTLLDKNAGDGAWMDAINNIVAPVTSTPVRAAYPIQSGRLFTNQPPPMRGEPLRSKTNPSVTELMLKYAESQQAPGVPDNPGYPGYADQFAIDGWTGYALQVAKWDAPASIPLLRTRMVKMLENWDACMKVTTTPGTWYPVDTTCTVVAKNLLLLASARLKAGDEAALDDYMNWISKMPAERYAKWQQEYATRFDNPDLFKLLWLYRNRPAVTNCARFMFDPQLSTLAPLLSATNAKSSIVLQEVGTPLSALAAFQPLIVEALKNKSPLGKSSVGTNGWVTVDSAGWLDSPPDLSRCTPNQAVEYRICDYAAWQLSRWDEMPRIALFWHKPHRDEAVAECLMKLQLVGPDLGKQKRSRVSRVSTYSQEDE